MDGAFMTHDTDCTNGTHVRSIHAAMEKLQSLALNSDSPSHTIRDGLEIEVDTSTWHDDITQSSPEVERDAYSHVYSPIASPLIASKEFSGTNPYPPSPTLNLRRLPSQLSSNVHAALNLSPTRSESYSSRSNGSFGLDGEWSVSSKASNDSDADGQQQSPVPFFPIIPMLGGGQDEQLPTAEEEAEGTQSPPLPGANSTIALTRSHLLQLASSSFGFLSTSVPSSACSSCPGSPDLGARHSHSPSFSVESFALHTPESPTWRHGSSLQHHSSMELSSRRRAHEAHGKSTARMRMKGLSSRAQQAQAHSFSPSLTTRDGQDSEFDGSDYDTPSPVSCSPSIFGRLRQPTAIQRIVKPLMSSQGYLNLQATHHALPHPSTLLTPRGSFDSSDTTLPPVDPEVLFSYLTPLSPTELAKTVHPIQALLPRGEEVLAIASEASSPLSPLTFDIERCRTMSNLHLCLLLNRCVARSHWRRTIPWDLLQHSYAFLDLESLLTCATRISKHWRAAVKDLLSSFAHFQSLIAEKQSSIKRKQKLKVYRRLTPVDMQHLLNQGPQDTSSLL